MRKLQEQVQQNPESEQDEPAAEAEAEEKFDRTEAPALAPDVSDAGSTSAFESTSNRLKLPTAQRTRSHAQSFASTRTAGSRRQAAYEANPYDIDWVNTRESFKK